jgi:serine/threonine-protein kinase
LPTVPDELDPELDVSRIAELERADRLEEAAELAERSGRPAQAMDLWDRACRWDRAATSALAAGQTARALLYAARSRRADLEQAAIDAALGASQASAAASLCERGGFTVSAARVLLAAGKPQDAAALFERGSAWLDAGDAHERAGQSAAGSDRAGTGATRHAQRCFERALLADAECHEARVRLGALLVGRAPESAAKLLQSVPPSAAEYPRALVLLESALSHLGLEGAAAQVVHTRAALGAVATDEPRAIAEGVQEPVPARPPRQGADWPVQADSMESMLFGRYRIQDRVATTPTAKVYRALDVLTDVEVAVKVFSTVALRETGRDALKRFEREAQILGGLRHPAIVPLVDYVPSGPAVILRWMPGGSLAELFAQGPLSPARAAEIVTAVLAALGEAHRRGILHRDIKPANVLFDAAGAAHLADFGTAHVSDSAATVTAGIIGTLAYMAPEQRAGRPATIQSDLYGAGALFWHALTGAPPDADLPISSDDLGPEHIALARRLIGPPAERPADAVEARRLIAELDWPRRTPDREVVAPRSVRTLLALPERLSPRGDGSHHDTLLDRKVLVLDASPEVLRRALPFARADHPALASILSLDPNLGSLWIEALDGPGLARPLTPAESAELGEALGCLHRAGGVHGSVDRAHLVEQGGMLRLGFAIDPKDATPADDLRALGELCP